MPDRQELNEQQFMEQFWAYFGPKKGIHMLGWALVMIPLAAVRRETGREMRERLEREGKQRSAMYRALADLRAFGQDLERRGLQPPGDDEIEEEEELRGRKIAQLVVRSCARAA